MVWKWPQRKVDMLMAALKVQQSSLIDPFKLGDHLDLFISFQQVECNSCLRRLGDQLVVVQLQITMAEA